MWNKGELKTIVDYGLMIEDLIILCPLTKELWLQFQELDIDPWAKWSLFSVNLHPQSWYPSLLTGVLCNDKNLLKLVLCPHGSDVAGHVALENNISETCAVLAIAVGWVSLAAKTKVSTSGWP